MQQGTTQTSPFLPLYDRSPQERAVAPPTTALASIWAPQPQPSDATWPRTIEAFARGLPQSREEAFGHGGLDALGTVGAAPTPTTIGGSNFGLAGSGPATPDLRSDSHVEQLLRTLNLNSPELQPAVVANLSPKSTGSAGSIGSRGSSHGGRTKPAPPPLDLSFGSNTSSSNTSSAGMTGTNSGSGSGTSSNTSTSTDNSSVLSARSVSLSGEGSFHQLQHPRVLSAKAVGCPESPDTDEFSPLSFASSASMSTSASVAVLTPLESAHPHSPIGVVGANTNNTTTLHSPIRAAHLNLNLQHQHQQQHYGGQTHSPTHTHPLSTLHNPNSPSHHAHSLHGSPLHSPTHTHLLGYKDHNSQQQQQQQQQRFAYGGYREHGYGSEPPSPYGVGYGVGPTHLHNQGRYVSLPPTPPGGSGSHVMLPPIDNLNAGPLQLHGLVHKRSLEAAYYQHQHQQALDRDATDGWIRGDSADLLGLGFGGAGGVEGIANSNGLGLGLGLGAGFAQTQTQTQNNTNNVGLGLGMGPRLGVSYGRETGYSAGGAPNASPLNTHTRATGSGVLGPEELNALRGSLVYHQQQQQLAAQTLLLHHQQQQQQQELTIHQQEPLEVKGAVNVGSSTMSRRGSASEAVPASPGHSPGGTRDGRGGSGTNEPINFLSLLHPSSSPPYATFVSRIIKSADQQASIFLQQKLKVAGLEERARIVDAICARGAEMMMHRFGNWAVQRCLEAAADTSERRKIVACMRGRVVDLATNCYGCHVLQKALDCDEEEIRLLIVSELLVGDPAQTLVNKHASHVWSKIMELSWTPPAPPIFAYVNKSLKGKWAALACHETGSLVVQHAFENLEESAKDGIVDELLGQGPATFAEVVKSQWGAYCIQHILEHGSEKHRQMALDHLIAGLLEFATNEQGNKSVTKALKEGGKDTLDRFVKRMCEPAKGARRAMIVDLALSPTGSQLIASVLPSADKEQRAALYDCIRGHIVTLRGCKTGSKVIWLFDRMRAYYGY